MDFAAINRAALSSFESLLREWLPEGHRAGPEYKSTNPRRSDNREGSFSINVVKGVWRDFATDDGGGDPVSLYAYLFTNDNQLEAAKALADRLGIVDADDRRPRQPFKRSAPSAMPAVPAEDKKPREVMWEPVTPAPADAVEPPKAHPHRGVPEHVWTYRDGAGAMLGFVYRFVTSDGGKEVLPLVWARHATSGRCEWRWMQWSEPRPLYGLDRLALRPDAPVLIVEGEKCADAPVLPVDLLPELVVVSWPGGGKAVRKVDWSPLAGRNVIIWPDCDAQREKTSKAEVAAGVDPKSKPLLPEAEQPGVKTAEQIAGILAGLGCKARIVTIPAPGEKPGGWDIADAIAEGMDAEVLKAFMRNQRLPAAQAPKGAPDNAEGTSTPPAAGAGTPEWMRGMLWKSRGVLEDCRENVFLLLTQHPAWAGIIAWDDFARRVVKRRRTPTGAEPGEWTGEDDMELGLWMAQQVRFLVKGEGTITTGVGMAAARAKFHPIAEYLAALPEWDGIGRVDFWLEECMGASAENVNYLRLVGRLFLIGMIARVMEPGCKWDYMPIFEGVQGKGKSTALRILGGQWFADTQLRIGDKDAYMQLDGVWLYEIGEMDSFNRSETTAVKAFVTTQRDRYREPYARRIIERPRQVAFAGTTNQGEYLKDTTGNRRFWPIRCRGRIDLDKLAEWRDQLFAEALLLYRKGFQWRPTREQEADWIRPEQEAREIVDPWLMPLQDYLYAAERVIGEQNEFTSYELLTKALGVDVDKIDNNRSAATRVGNLMQRLHWGKRRQSTGRRDWVYVRPAETVEEAQPAATAARPAQAIQGVGATFGDEYDPVAF